MQLTSLLQIFTYGNTSAVHRTTTHLWKLASVPEVPVAQLYKYMIDWSEPTLPFEINRDTEEESSLM